VTVGVYATPEAFVAANIVGSMQPVGASPFGRVVLSPGLGSQQRRRLPAILTHELSHAHIQGWISAYAYIRLPNWFKEGLAVMVSGGGGAEFVAEAEASAAIERGQHIAINDTGSVFNLSDIRFEGEPPPGTRSHQIVTAYRQAGMFVAWLHDSDTAGFARMMDAILDGRSFVHAVDAGYHRDVNSLWQRFAQTGAERK
jgi:hypothetical protein